MIEVYAVDYGVPPDGNGRMQTMDMRPLLDAVAAKHDGCLPCEEHHVTSIAADPALITHVVGVGLLNLGIHEATARQLLQHMDPDGCAIAMAIRNEGLLSAVNLARSKNAERRRTAARVVLSNAITAVQWFGMPISNLCPPVVERPTGHLGDTEMIKDLRSDGYW
ncbi:hypothetical protein ACIBP4_04500 [Micromonospora maritima]|uniref:Uncharacterized protein n=1 Tax=Micromonospora maritima TaxID=986711 RepID=A0ABW7ZHE2_9ACTN